MAHRLEDKQAIDSASDIVDSKHADEEVAYKRPDEELTVRETLILWKKGILWSFILSWTVIMESYDTILKTQFYAFPSFNYYFGYRTPNGSWNIGSQWQAALGSGVFAALIIGGLIGSPLIDRYGYRWTMTIGLVLNVAFLFIIFFAHNLPVFLAGNMLCALPWGMFAVAAPAYAVDVVPVKIRSYLTSYVNLCWVLGHVLAAGILRGFIGITSQWGWRIPVALGFVPPIPIAIGIWLGPEAPSWLVRKGRIEEAVEAVRRCHAVSDKIDDVAIVAQIQRTQKYEQDSRVGASYISCFKGSNLRRTEIACIAWIAQALVGFVVQGFNTYFFRQAGIPADKAFLLGFGNYCIAFVGTCSSWVLQTYAGRRTIFMYGLVAMFPLMLTVGFLDLAVSSSDGARWAQAVMLMIWFFVYGFTIGPLPYIIASESGAVQLRQKTITLARSAYSVFFILNQVLSPYMLTAWDLKGKAAFPAAFFQLCLFIWAFFRLPEMKGRSFHELDILFNKKTPTRQFKKTYVDIDEHEK